MRARAHLSNGDVKAALGDLNRALELDPRHAAAYNDRCHILSDTGEQEAALADYNRALELNPRFARAYNNRASVRTHQRDYRAAIADYDRAIERTFARLSFHRRLSKDYEYLPETSEAFIRITMTRLTLARLT